MDDRKHQAQLVDKPKVKTRQKANVNKSWHWEIESWQLCVDRRHNTTSQC